MINADLITTIAFYLFASLAVAAALAAVVSQRMIRAAVGLAVTLLSSAAFYVLLGLPFVATLQVLVYVGGIVVLIVFAVMLTSSTDLRESHPDKIRIGAGVLSSLAFVVSAIAAVASTPIAMHAVPELPAETARLFGLMLLGSGRGEYLLAFEVISLLLLAAVIGAIVIARAGRADMQHGEKAEVPR